MKKLLKQLAVIVLSMTAFFVLLYNSIFYFAAMYVAILLILLLVCLIPVHLYKYFWYKLRSKHASWQLSFVCMDYDTGQIDAIERDADMSYFASRIDEFERLASIEYAKIKPLKYKELIDLDESSDDIDVDED